MHRLWLILSQPQTMMEVNVVISILFLVWLLAFTSYLMAPISIVTNCHNLVPKKNKKKNLFQYHFRIVWTLSGSELTRGDQTVVNESIELVSPMKWTQSHRSKSSFLGWWWGWGGGGYSQIKVMGVFIRYFEVMPEKVPRYCFLGMASSYFYF